MACNWITCQECGRRLSRVEEMRNRFCDECLEFQLRLTEALRIFDRAVLTPMWRELTLKG